jgi:hypothetical protein
MVFDIGKSLLLQVTHLCYLFCVNGACAQVPVNDYSFQGVVYYRYESKDAKGAKLLFPIEEEERDFDTNHILTKTLKGYGKSLIGNKDFWLDAEKGESLIIDHDSKTISINKHPGTEEIAPLEFSKLPDVEVCQYWCEVYFIKYVYRMEHMKMYLDNKPDTLSSIYYVAKDMKIPNARKFAALQGNHNTLILDGRFSGVPLRVIMKRADGIVTTIEAMKVEPKEMSQQLRLPDYAIQH